ncbi:MAG: cytochrome b [Proteobacteria bacterium]|nr:cytochrome b [Pseudomonadota bacterium]
MQKPPEKFGPVAIALHWLMALGVVLSVIFGLGTVYIDDTQTSRSALALHQSIGFVMLLLALGRLYWRATHAAPPLPEGMATGQRVASFIMHATLYLFLLGMPVTGYIGLAARGREIPVFGLFNLPHLVPRSFDLSALSQDIHYYAQFALYVLVVLHIAAALYHRFVLKDGVLERMLPGRKTLQSDTV